MSQQRHSRAEEAPLVTDEAERARIEVENGLRQFDLGMKIVEEALTREPPFRLRASVILALHRAALDRLSAFAGSFRPAGVRIEHSNHEPPGPHRVPELVEDMCDYVNSNIGKLHPLHLCAYVMWRLNWIHPFDDGNGRTSRIASYVVLCAALRNVLPGEESIPAQIERDRQPYFDALEAADAAFAAGQSDLTQMEELLGGMLARQLVRLYETATGTPTLPPSSAGP